MSYRNALKHASASSYLYSGLLGLSEALAEDMAVRCGMVNEFTELYVKRGKPDTTSAVTGQSLLLLSVPLDQGSQ